MENGLKNAARRFIYAYYQRLYQRREPYRLLFIISHMRAGSSLLTHLLVSHPEIFGYGETHLEYSTPRTRHDLVAKVAMVNRLLFRFGDERYVLDKILHNKLLTVDYLPNLCDQELDVIFLIRHPSGSIPSMMKTFGFSQEAANRHYSGRLQAMGDLYDRLDGSSNIFTLEYEELTDKPDDSLERLTEFLNLVTPLSRSYSLHRTTGRRGLGDSGPNIYAGEILPSSDRQGHSSNLGDVVNQESVDSFESLRSRWMTGQRRT
jgi:hypothetical protein